VQPLSNYFDHLLYVPLNSHIECFYRSNLCLSVSVTLYCVSLILVACDVGSCLNVYCVPCVQLNHVLCVNLK